MRGGIGALLMLAVAMTSAVDRRIVGYYTSWSTYGRNYQVSQIPGDRLDVINYAFARISTTGRIELMDAFADVQKSFATNDPNLPFRGNFNQLVVLKRRYPHLKTMISVADSATEFSDMARTATGRANFSASVIAFLLNYRFDGIDIDWEFPVSSTGRPEDRANYTLLMRQLRQDLNAQGLLDGKRYLVTCAVSGGYPEVANLEVPQLAAECDWLNVMNYDYAGSWSTTASHLAPLYGRTGPTSTEKWNLHYTFNTFLAAGAPPAKLHMGVPFYAVGWKGVGATNNGLRQPITGGSAPGTWGTGVWGYDDVVDLLANQPTVYFPYYDSNAQAPWVYAPSLNGGTFISHDNPTSVTAKANYSISRGLGGMMIWELSGDKPTATHSLLDTMDRLIVPHVSPTSHQVLAGTLRGGTTDSLSQVDSNSLRVGFNLAVSRGMPQAEVIMNGVSRVPVPTQLSLKFRLNAEQATARAEVDAWDWATGVWVRAGTADLTNTAQAVTWNLANPTRFVQTGTSAFRYRARFFKTGPVTRSSGIALDQAVWVATR